MINKRALFVSYALVIALLGTACQYSTSSSDVYEKNANTENDVSAFVSETIDNSDNVQNNSVSDSLDENKLTETVPVADTTKNIDKSRIININSGFDFPPDDLAFVNNDVFEIIQVVYSKADFFGEFKKGNVDEYDFYMENFRRLLKNEVTFLEPHTGMEFYLNQYDGTYLDESGELTASISLSDGIANLDKAVYHFFDMDECGAPELCIDVGATYIFKYLPDSDGFVLWYESGSLWYELLGSRKVCYVGGGVSHVFYKLDDDGEDEYTFHFFSEEHYNEKLEQAETVFMVALPQYADKSKEIEMTEEIKNQVYVDKWTGRYYCRVTEEQYDELTNDYFQSVELARERIKDVSFSYEDLVEAHK